MVTDMVFQKSMDVRQHSLLQILSLHLLPGLFITFVFTSIAAAMSRFQLPASLALLLTWLVIGIPIELGILLYQGRKENGHISLKGIVLFREPLPVRQYLWLVAVLLLWTALVSTIFVPLSEALRKVFFGWWPDWLILSNFVQKLNQYPASVLWTIVILSFVLNIAIPVMEEMYFRGFLLPRMSHLNQWAPLTSVVLFSLYHFWLPWENPARIIALLPVVYAVQWKRNIYLSVMVHCLLNTIGSIGLLVLVMNR
jgi:CAAX protease family protein